jgi:hypothetical protein
LSSANFPFIAIAGLIALRISTAVADASNESGKR